MLVLSFDPTARSFVPLEPNLERQKVGPIREAEKDIDDPESSQDDWIISFAVSNTGNSLVCITKYEI